MDNEYILNTVLKQSAFELSCEVDDLLKSESCVFVSKPSTNARKYLKLPFGFNMVSYGSNNVVACSSELFDFSVEFVKRADIYRYYEPELLYDLNDELKKYGMCIKHMADFYLPDVARLNEALKVNTCDFKLKILGQREFSELYKPEWSNALCEARKELDVLGVGAYDGERLIGLAGCSADCEDMRQIGIDVLPEYRKMGVAKTLVTKLAAEIIENGNVPFYCAAWSNVKSRSTAVSSGFVPGWVEMMAKNID